MVDYDPEHDRLDGTSPHAVIRSVLVSLLDDGDPCTRLVPRRLPIPYHGGDEDGVTLAVRTVPRDYPSSVVSDGVSEDYLRGSSVNRPWFGREVLNEYVLLATSRKRSGQDKLGGDEEGESGAGVVWGQDDMDPEEVDRVRAECEAVRRVDQELRRGETQPAGVTWDDVWAAMKSDEAFKTDEDRRKEMEDMLRQYQPSEEQLGYYERRRATLDENSTYVLGEGKNESAGAARTVNLASSKQSAFRLDHVFNQALESELFGLSADELARLDEDDDYEDNDKTKVDGSAPQNDTSGVRTGSGKEENEEDGDIAQLNDELDRMLTPESIAKLKERKAKEQRRQARVEQDKYAMLDESSVDEFSEMLPNPVIEYPFDLDVFQKRAVLRLERGETVFVAAHTSAGKTVVAEYAIALCQSHGTKAIYTSPIKTLSNQKYRDFSKTFSSVGIVTGDVSINPEANCLIMTTEILRSMLYKGADVIRDIEWVIFDEVHYVNDEERGVVWEEVIIMLPEHVGIIMLSATVPNALEFASWVGKTKRRKVYVISTLKRPVPLEHHILVRKEMFTLVDTKRNFMNLNYKTATDADAELQKKIRQAAGGGRAHAWPTLVNFLEKNSLTPCVVFCFSKRMCEEAVESLKSLDLSQSGAEKAQIHLFFENSIKRLSNDDRALPQILRVRETLKRGIGVHHAGLLPLVKEITEILFSRGLVRVLYATETFAMGVNMPARSVVFSSVRKNDGRGFRFLEPGEYTQMAGRAGRRGLDSVGTVILYFAPGNIPSLTELKSVMVGTPLRLRSQFRLTYNMILNLLRVEDVRVEDVIRRSFCEAPAERDGEKIRKLLVAGRKKLRSLEPKLQEFQQFLGYQKLSEKVDRLTQRINESILASSQGFIPGRVVLLTRRDRGLGMGVILKPPRKAPIGSRAASAQLEFFIAVLHLRGSVVSTGSTALFDVLPSIDPSIPQEVQQEMGFFFEIKELSQRNILSLAKKKLKLDGTRLMPARGLPDREELVRVLSELHGLATTETLPEAMHPRKDLGLNDIEMEEMWKARENDLCAMRNSECLSNPRFGIAFDLLSQHSLLKHKMEQLEWAISDSSLQLLPDFSQRMEVLKSLRYINDEGSVQLKGRAACEVNSCDSLVLTEVVFENIIMELQPCECAALMSAFVFQEKTDAEIEIPTESLQVAKAEVSRILLALGTVQADAGLPVSPIEFEMSTARYGLCAAVWRWASGAPFKEICAVTDVPEGSIVRCIIRVSDLMRETRNVARVIGNAELYTKMEEANESIRRDIIFAASLYLT